MVKGDTFSPWFKNIFHHEGREEHEGETVFFMDFMRFMVKLLTEPTAD